MHRIFEILKKLEIEYTNYEHDPVFTCDEAKGVEIPGKRVKSLLLKNKKATNFYMVILPDYKQLDVNKVRYFFNDTKLSFVSTEQMQELIKLKPGHVSPYALINNEEKNIKLAIDSELELEKVGFHPLKNDNTVVTNMKGIEKFLGFLGAEFYYLEL